MPATSSTTRPGGLLGEYDAGGAPLYETLYLASTPVGVLKQTGSAATGDIAVTVYNVHADHIDTPRVITKQDQTIVWRWDAAEAFGATAPDQNPAGTGVFSFNQRFPGQVFDAETGLFQNWNREYSARIGRYVQSDPIGLQGGINTFSYVGANPLSFIDPLGLQASPDDRPTAPGPFVPNPSAAAQRDLAKMLDRIFCPKEPDCWDLQQQMEEVAGELRQRYVSMTADVGNLFCTRPIGRFSWRGHQMKFNDKRRQLQKLIEQAQVKGCPVNGEYIKLAAMDPPSCPAR